MAWYNLAWPKRKPITIAGSSAGALTHYSVNISVTYAAGMLADFTDLRFTDTDGVTPIPYWIESYVASTSASVWLCVPAIPADPETATVYMYYGGSNLAYTLPPTSLATRPATAVGDGLAENMVYDSVGEKYYVVTTHAVSGPIHLWRADAPTGPWTDLGTILDVGSAGTWDDSIVYAPHLFKDGSTWYLYYSGGPDAGGDDHCIGYATSSSPEGPFTKYASNPVLSNSNAVGYFDRYRACEGYVFKRGEGDYQLWYMGDAGSGATQVETVGFATAPAATGPWTKQQTTTPAIGLGAAGEFDATTVADPFVYGPLNGLYYVFYTCGNRAAGALPWNIAVATTSDFVTFRKMGPIYSHGVYDEWDNFSAFRGAITYDAPSGNYYMPYTGTDRGNTYWKWGVATMQANPADFRFKADQALAFFDHFPGVSLDASHWAAQTTAQSIVAVADSVLTLTATRIDGGIGSLGGRREFWNGYLIVVRAKHTASGGGNKATEVGFSDEYQRMPTARIYGFNSTKFIKGTVQISGANTAADMTESLDANYHDHYIWLKSTSEVDYKLDSGSWQTVVATLPDAGMLPWLMIYDGGASPRLDVDSVLVRKYVEPEPVPSIGTEETLPSPSQMRAPFWGRF